ncbi:MAG: hypothetical protein IJN20_01280 [Oscillospiraceae bacterium]|nr:hypothetical protein [Oscillospiraceae bacterium]
MKKQIIITLIIILVLVLVVMGGILGYNHWYQSSHVFVEDVAYEKETTFVDLRGTGATLEYYETLRSQLPDCEIRYDLPFQGGFYPDDTKELTITSLTDAEIELLDYLPLLETVDARDCTDYNQLIALQKRHPEWNVLYTVSFLGVDYNQDASEMVFGTPKTESIDEAAQEETEPKETQSDKSEVEETQPLMQVEKKPQPQLEELRQVLAWLPDMKTIHFHQPEMSGQDLVSLREAYPDINVTWEKDAFGTTYSHDVTEIELEDMYFASLDEVEAQTAYFPELQKLVLLDCGYDKKNLFDDETLAAFREKMRPNYKVVWSMNLYGMTIRTDDLYFMPNKYGVKVSTYGIQRLRYCEDMLCVDLGHHNIVDLSFVEGMPHLKYFICIDSNLLYIEPLGTCKELVYCELFWTPISDFTPLLGCTALEDLNVARTNGDPMVFKDMPWLKNLWIRGSAVNAEERKILEEALPNTYIQYCDYEMTRNGWRELQNYYDMRDLLGMSYNTW